MWNARTKNDLIIEVWEKLDCENIGAAEIEAIEIVLAEQYGKQAVASPMIIARLLADEGAELRHSEIMNLYIERAENRPYDAAFRNILNIDDLTNTLSSIRKLENLRRKYFASNDKEGLRHVRDTALRGKQAAAETAGRENLEPNAKKIYAEIAEWMTIWLQSAELFENWVALRQNSPEFTKNFGNETSDT